MSSFTGRGEDRTASAMSTPARGNPGGADDDKRPSDFSTHVSLKVQSQDNEELVFRVKRNNQLRILMNTYCQMLCINLNSFVFLFDGRRILPEQTPNELKLEDGDAIDVVRRQIGG